MCELEAELVRDIWVDLERMPEPELRVGETGFFGKSFVEQLADDHGVRSVDRVCSRQVVVLTSVDDDTRARVDLPRESLIDERPYRVDVTEDDPVHAVVEHHVEPLETGKGCNLRHAQPGRIVGQPHVPT